MLLTTTPGDVNVYSPNLIRARDGGILLLFMRQHATTTPAITQYVWQSADEGRSFAPLAEFVHGGGEVVVKGSGGGRGI